MSLNPDLDFAHEHRVDELTREITAQMEGLQSLLASLQRECEEMRKENKTLRRALTHVADELDGQLRTGSLLSANYPTRVYWAQVEGVARDALATMHADEEGR